MRRSTAALLVAGGTGLFVTLGVLVRAVHSEAAAVDVSSPRHPSAPVASRAEDRPNAAAPSWSAPAGRQVLRDQADDSTDPSPAPSLEHGEPGTMANRQHLEFGGKQLRDQTAAVEPLIRACIDTAVAAGRSPTGKATLTYIVTKHGDKVGVEDTGIDDDTTTLPAGPLLDCLRDTSRGMKFEGLPREAQAIVATRRVTVDHGKLVENEHVTFSYLR